MGILPDKWIRKQATKNNMIDPFCEKQKADGIISYGLSSYGYDARLDNKFKIFHNLKSAIINPKDFSADSFVEEEGDICIVPPNSYVLACTVERFKIPRDVMVVCLGKSTYARAGIIVNVTPLEPEWEGTVTLEISNATPSPVQIFANEGICQFLFFKAEEVCETSYADRAGKYQGQSGITLAKVMKKEEEKIVMIHGQVEAKSVHDVEKLLPLLMVGASILVKDRDVSSMPQQSIIRRMMRGKKESFNIYIDDASSYLTVQRVQ